SLSSCCVLSGCCRLVSGRFVGTAGVARVAAAQVPRQIVEVHDGGGVAAVQPCVSQPDAAGADLFDQVLCTGDVREPFGAHLLQRQAGAGIAPPQLLQCLGDGQYLLCAHAASSMFLICMPSSSASQRTPLGVTRATL